MRILIITIFFHLYLSILQIGTVREPELRVQIVTQRSEFDENPATFRKAYNDSQNALTNRIVEARQLVKQVCVVFENKCC